MSLQKIALKKTDLTEEGLRAAHEAKHLQELLAHGVKQPEAEKNVAAQRRQHQCDAPKVTEKDGMAPGSTFTCDTCGRKKELVYLSYANPWDPSGDSRWGWRNLPHANAFEDRFKER